jgi:hypothetical protein
MEALKSLELHAQWCPLRRSADASTFRLVPGVSGSPAFHVMLVIAALLLVPSGLEITVARIRDVRPP